jgi:PleD family two-component response regulator
VQQTGTDNRWRPAAVLAGGEMLMPSVDGLELCRRVRADAGAGYTYIILATALSDRRDVLRGMEAGADDYLIKPVDLFDLRMRLIAAQRVTDLHAELARHRAQLTHLARHDPLTGLGNRRSLGQDLGVLYARSRRYGRGFAWPCVRHRPLQGLQRHPRASGRRPGFARGRGRHGRGTSRQ